MADSDTAKHVGTVLRRVLWEVARVSILLPEGLDALNVLEAFRQGRSSLLVTTASAIRGLDLPAIHAIYCLGAPSTAADYAHTAGRLGRIGAAPGDEPAQVVSIVTKGAQVQQLRDTADALGIQLREITAAPPRSLSQHDEIDVLRKGLNDVFEMY